MPSIFFDIRRACRSLWKSPGFSAIVVLTMTVGIGANLAIFGYLGLFLWPTVQAPEPERLVWLRSPVQAQPLGWPSSPDLRDLIAKNEVFSEVGGARVFGTGVHTDRGSQHGWGFGVTGGYFALLGAKPHLGRLIEPADDHPGARRVVVLNHHYWKRHFAADPAAVGSTLTLDNGLTFTVVGVAPKGFQGTGLAGSLYIPLATAGNLIPDREKRETGWIATVARLRPGIEIEAAEASLAPLAQGLDELYPRREPRHFRLSSATEQYWEGEESPLARGARLLMVAVGLLLLLACANVANLMLARATVRRREMGILAALGADRRRLATQLLAESLILAGLGGLLGSIVGRKGLAAIETYLLHTNPVGLGEWGHGSSIPVDSWPTTLFFVGITVVSALLFGLAPVFQVARQDLVSALASDLGTDGGHRRIGARQLLVVLQVALSLVLLTSAGLLARSLLASRAENPGFAVDGLQLATFHNPTRDDDAAAISQYEGLLEEARQLPGVFAAGLVRSLPLGGFNRRVNIRQPGSEESLPLESNVVSQGYFDTLGLSWLQGRDFEARDQHEGAATVVVNHTAAEHFWPDQNPVGQTLTVLGRSDTETSYEVIGVVASHHDISLLQEPEPTAYFTFHQRFARRLTLVARSRAPLEKPLHDLLRDRFPELVIIESAPFREQMRRALGDQHMHVRLAGTFSGIGLLLAGLGIFSVLSYSISRRRREIGLRLAVGAERTDVLRLVLRETSILLGAGLLTGLAAAWALTRLLESLLHGVGHHDPVTFTAVVLVLCLTALAAAFVPARRASRIEPVEALRQD